MARPLRIAALAAMLCGCGYLVDAAEACRTAAAHGFTACSVTATHAIAPALAGGCGERDDVGFDVDATNPRGQRVALSVCCGWPFKGCTMRVR